MRWYKYGDPTFKPLRKDNSPAALIAKFNEKWQLKSDTGCWQWTGATHLVSKRWQYRSGEIKIDGRKYRAHRVSWTLHNGLIPEGKDILHKCNNSLYVNPDHLYPGTPAENGRDMAVSLRAAPMKLMPDVVRAIRASNEGHATLAIKYGVTRQAIFRIRKRLAHRHVI